MDSDRVYYNGVNNDGRYLAGGYEASAHRMALEFLWGNQKPKTEGPGRRFADKGGDGERGFPLKFHENRRFSVCRASLRVVW